MLIAIKTLGCKVNQYETEMLKERFQKNGHEIVSENDFADVYIINTCTVTSLADRKSRQYIRKMKKSNPQAVIAVTGCYAQVSPEEVAAIQEVDIVAGTNKKGELPDLIEQYINEKKSETVSLVDGYDGLCEYIETGIITSMESRTRAYIKVQEGCNRFCSYCIIPYARGKVRSRAVKDVIEEAKSLVSQGFKEIVLTGINTALYGTEEGFAEANGLINGLANAENGSENAECDGIEILLKELEAMDGDFRIRLSSLEPTVINAEYVKKLMKYKRLCPHLHLSVQSGSDNILKAMNRRYDRTEYLDIVRVLKEFDSGYGLTTDIIAGFPTETEEDFRDSLDIVEKVEFCKVHAFKYSKRQGTKAAEMKGHIAPEIKNKRSKELIEAGERATRSFFQKCIGQERTLLIEEYDEAANCFTGYTENYIKAYLPCEFKDDNEKIQSLLNTFVEVRMTELFKDGMKALKI